MLKPIILICIIALQLLPQLLTLDDDEQWQVWCMSMLVIVILQAYYIYMGASFKNKIIKILATFILLLSMWFAYDYVVLLTDLRVLCCEPKE